MTQLTAAERMAVAGLLGTSGHTLAHIWQEEGFEDDRVQDAFILGRLIGWDHADLEGLWCVGLALCTLLDGTDDEA